MRALLFFIPPILISCSDATKPKQLVKAPAGEVAKSSVPQRLITASDTIAKEPKPFPLVVDCPVIKDSAAFIKQLKQTTILEACINSEEPIQSERITSYKAIRLNGSRQRLILVEYRYNGDIGVCFPWKCQLLFTQSGQFVKLFWGLRFELLSIPPTKYPFLLLINSTYQGNGWHTLYRASGDSLECVLNTNSLLDNYSLRTYDADIDNSLNIPNELKITTTDNNNDGYNDLIFSGNLLQNKLGNNVDDDKLANTNTPVKYVYLYQKKTGHFILKESSIAALLKHQ